MPRHIKVKPGRIPDPFATPTDNLAAADALFWVIDRIHVSNDPAGFTDSAVPVLTGGSGALFGGNFGGNF